MALEIKVPPMGESISEATVAGWRKKPGDPVSAGDILVELETDKVTMEVPAPGLLDAAEYCKKERRCCKTRGTLATLDDSAGAVAASPAPASAKPAERPRPRR